MFGGDGGVQDAAVRAARHGGSAGDAGANRVLLSERGRVLSAASRHAGHADELLGEYPRGGALLPLAAGAVHRAHLRHAAAAEDHQPRAAVCRGFRGVAKNGAGHRVDMRSRTENSSRRGRSSRRHSPFSAPRRR